MRPLRIRRTNTAVWPPSAAPSAAAVRHNRRDNCNGMRMQMRVDKGMCMGVDINVGVVVNRILERTDVSTGVA